LWTPCTNYMHHACLYEALNFCVMPGIYKTIMEHVLIHSIRCAVQQKFPLNYMHIMCIVYAKNRISTQCMANASVAWCLHIQSWNDILLILFIISTTAHHGRIWVKLDTVLWYII
jgi:hypothetical protein